MPGETSSQAENTQLSQLDATADYGGPPLPFVQENTAYILEIVREKQKSLLKIKINMPDLFDLIDKYAAGGWKVHRMLSVEKLPFLGNKNAYMVIFKRDAVI